MQVFMAVHQLFMPVRVHMDEVGPQKKIMIGKKIFRLAIGYYTM